MKILKKYSGRTTRGYQIKTDLSHNFYVYHYADLLFTDNTMDACRKAVKTFTDKRISAMQP